MLIPPGNKGVTAARHGRRVEELPLSGFTVAVTAARRREELTALLQRRGARVIEAPAIRIIPTTDDVQLRAATEACITRPPDVVVATTGIGFRGWMEAADGWGLGESLGRHLETMGLRVELSSDAGRYLCNAALFRSLSLAARGKGARLAGFVHIPAALADAITMADIEAAGLPPPLLSQTPGPIGPAPACSLQDFDWSRAITGSLAIVEICLAHAAAGLELCSGRGLGPATGSTGVTV